MASNTDFSALQEQVEDLQMRIAFQDDTIAELSDVIATQDKLLSQLQRQQQMFTDKFKSIEHSLDHSQDTPAQERPPHY